MASKAFFHKVCVVHYAQNDKGDSCAKAVFSARQAASGLQQGQQRRRRDGSKQVTDDTSYDITVKLRGKDTTTTYSGVDALFENDSYAYYKLSEAPAYYATAWYNVFTGSWEFGKVKAAETTVNGATVELVTNGHHTDYEMKVNGFELDSKTNTVYGVVLTTADGEEYGLHHVTNIWLGTELGFDADDAYSGKSPCISGCRLFVSGISFRNSVVIKHQRPL